MFYIAAYDVDIKNTVDIYKDEELKGDMFSTTLDNAQLVELTNSAAKYFMESSKVNTLTNVQFVLVNENRKILFRSPETIPNIDMTSADEYSVIERLMVFVFTAQKNSGLFTKEEEQPTETPVEETPTEPTPVEDPQPETQEEESDAQEPVNDEQEETPTEEVVAPNPAKKSYIGSIIVVIAILVVIGVLVF